MMFLDTKAKAFINLIEKYSKCYKDLKPSALMESILIESKYNEELKNDGDQDKIDNIAELKQSLCEYENSLGEQYEIEEYLQNIALLSNIDKKEKQNSIKLMTVHASKGLEFPGVFVCSLSENIFPSKNIKNKDELEEERRLAFVAFTRAKDRLFLSDSEGFNYEGQYRYPSRFIFDIKKEFLHYISELRQELIMQTKRIIETQLMTFSNSNTQILKGSRISHPVFGSGTLVGYDDNNDYIILFDKMKTERHLSKKVEISIL